MEFQNVSEFTRYLNSNMETVNTETLEKTGDWTGVDTWKGFEGYLETGNPEVTAKVRKHSKHYIDKFEDLFSESAAYQFDVVGEFFDIGAVMVGEPEAWIKEIIVKDDKFIELKIQGTYSDGTDLEMVKENGAKVFAIATVLEQQGYLVRIDMVYRTRESDTKHYKKVTEVTIKVKDYNQGLDYKKFGILLGVPFFRRGILRLLEIEYGNSLRLGYGCPMRQDGDINLDEKKDVAKLEKMLKKDK